MKGIVSAVSIQRNSVCIDEKWYPLGELVNSKYIKKGANVEYSIQKDEAGESYVTFIKTIKEDFIDKTPIKPANAFKPRDFINNELNNEAIRRMSAIKSATSLFEGTGKTEECKKFIEELDKYIVSGSFGNSNTREGGV